MAGLMQRVFMNLTHTKYRPYLYYVNKYKIQFYLYGKI